MLSDRDVPIRPHDQMALEQVLESFGRRDLTCLEIGSWFGAGSTQILAKYAKTLICVDHWKGNATPHHQEVASTIDVFRAFRKNVQRFGETVIPIMCSSARIGGFLGEKVFDFAYIDGDHRYDATLTDIRNVKPLLKRGGVLAGHDCEGRVEEENKEAIYLNCEKDSMDSVYKRFRHCHPGVIRAVHEEIENANLFAELPFVVDGEMGASTVWWTKI